MGILDEQGAIGAPIGNDTHPALCSMCAKRISEPTSRAHGAFLANMSHELRTPLNGIIGFSELLEAEHIGPLNAEQRAYVDHILTSGRHLLTLVNDLLDLSKLDTGRLALDREWSSFDAVVEGAVSQVARFAASHEIEINLDLEAELPVLFIDPMRMRQVVSNLLLHCAKRAGENGHVTLRVAAEGQTVCLTAIDDGPSMNEEEIRALFGGVECLDVASDSEGDTTDLGFALTKRLIDMHGGTIEVSSAGARGSRFEVVLPAPTHSVDALSTPPLENEVTDEVVLVTDDDPQARELIAGHLRAAGVSVIFARNAEAAVELATVMHPVAITLDIKMPGADGWTALQHLKRAPVTRGIPVIVVSIADESQRAKRLGASGFESKPVSKHGILSAVSRVGVTLHLLDDVRVMILDQDNPEVDRVEAKLRRAGCEVTRPSASARNHSLENVDVVVLDTTIATHELSFWLEQAAASPRPFLVIGTDDAVTERITHAHLALARTTFDEISGFPERLIRQARALLEGRGAQQTVEDAHDAR